MTTGCCCTARTALRLTSDGFYGGGGSNRCSATPTSRRNLKTVNSEAPQQRRHSRLGLLTFLLPAASPVRLTLGVQAASPSQVCGRKGFRIQQGIAQPPDFVSGFAQLLFIFIDGFELLLVFPFPVGIGAQPLKDVGA